LEREQLKIIRQQKELEQALHLQVELRQKVTELEEFIKEQGVVLEQEQTLGNIKQTDLLAITVELVQYKNCCEQLEAQLRELKQAIKLLNQVASEQEAQNDQKKLQEQKLASEITCVSEKYQAAEHKLEVCHIRSFALTERCLGN